MHRLSNGRLGAAAFIFVVFTACLAAPRAEQPQPPQQRPSQPQPSSQPQPQQPPPPPGTPTKALVPVAASTLASKPDQYVGEFVSLTGVIDQTLSKLAFSVDQDKNTSGKDVLVLAPRMNDPVTPNTYVTVVGEVVRFDAAEIAAKLDNFPVDLARDVADRYRGRPAIIARHIINAAGVDVAMRLPPPMTPAEEAYQKIMKQVASSNAALRKAIEGSDVKLARENMASLKQAFTQTESFWKARGKGDAMAWAQDGRKLAETIDRAAEAGKWEEVKATAGTLGKMCQTCHTTYRERYDDGSFRIKPGG